jgi:hypothetical protein
LGILHDENTIGKNAFRGCKNLTEVYVQSRTKIKIGKGAFQNCANLKKIRVDSYGVKRIDVGSKAFKGVNNIYVSWDNGDRAKNFAKAIKKSGAKKVTYRYDNLDKRVK